MSKSQIETPHNLWNKLGNLEQRNVFSEANMSTITELASIISSLPNDWEDHFDLPS